MYSAVLESFDGSDFLKFVQACSGIWETDALFSGEGFHGEILSICYIKPVNRYETAGAQPEKGLRNFIKSENKESFGFLSYDLGLELKDIKTAKKLFGHKGLFKTYTAYAVHKNGCLNIRSECSETLKKTLSAFKNFKNNKSEIARSEIRCSMTSEEYIEKVRQVLEYIKDGHTYQLNLSVKFQAETDVSPVLLWCSLAENHKAPFYTLFHTDEGCIISASPERFIKVTDRRVLSQPIKGTLQVESHTPESEKELTGSPKESAELSMIVDLIRNDISAACSVGSVKVREHKSVMKVGNLLQMYSSVSGILDKDADALDLLFSAFPGGSVTGCPKKRSMELIDRLEPHSRGVYCGSMVRITDLENLDSSICIRTGVLKDGVFSFYAGSGIVADSIPEKEFEETMNKADKFLELFR